MDVQLPNGKILRGVPDGTTRAQLAQKLQTNGFDVPGEWMTPAASPEPTPSMGGTGGYNPMLARLGGASLAVGNELGMEGKDLDSMANAFGPAEVLLQAGTGAVATPVAGLAGAGQAIVNKLFPDPSRTSAADRVKQVQGAMTYQPRTGVGAAFSRVAGAPSEVLQAGTNKAGEVVTDVTGSPLIGAAIKTAGDIAPSIVGARLAMTGGATPRAHRGATEKYVSTKYDVPTTEQLTQASKQAYEAGKESGVIVAPEGYTKALASVRKMATEEGIDPTLHPKSLAVMKRLEEAEGKPLSLQEAETLRKIALDAEDDLNPVTRQATPDARLAGKIVDQLDQSIEALSVNTPARQLWARSRKSQMVDQMVHRAEIKAGAHYTQAGMEHALRQEFKQLALNPRRMRGLTKDQRAAVEKVAKGGAVENTLRALGKFDPTTSVVAAAGSIGTGALLTPLTGGASALLPVAGFGAKRVATNMTKRNVERAREALVGRGVPSAGQSPGVGTTPQAAVSQNLLAKLAPPTVAKARTAEAIQAEIRQLTSRAPFELAKESAGSPKVQAFSAALARLQHELSAIREDR